MLDGVQSLQMTVFGAGRCISTELKAIPWLRRSAWISMPVNMDKARKMLTEYSPSRLEYNLKRFVMPAFNGSWSM
jgi:hypothetical protein